jgi:glutathione synthase
MKTVRPKVHLLLPEAASVFRPGNAHLFAEEFARRGLEVWACAIHSVGLSAGNLELRGALVEATDLDAPPRSLRVGPVPVSAGDVLWILGRPVSALSKEVLSILNAVASRHSFVNTPSALALLDSKASVHSLASEFAIPQTLITSNLSAAVARYRGAEGELVAKPLVGDSGGSVYAVRPGDSNAEVILQSLTGDAAAKPILYPASVHGVQARFAVIQPKIPQLPENEKRVIVAGGQVVVAVPKYLRSGSHRATTSGQEATDPVELSSAELSMCSQVAERLRRAGVHFAGIDVSREHVIEINIFNPGGLSCLSSEHLGPAVHAAADRLLEALLTG